MICMNILSIKIFTTSLTLLIVQCSWRNNSASIIQQLATVLHLSMEHHMEKTLSTQLWRPVDIRRHSGLCRRLQLDSVTVSLFVHVKKYDIKEQQILPHI